MITASDAAEIIVACIGGVVAVLVAVLAVVGQRLRGENRDQHAASAEKLDRLAGKVDLLHDDLRDHVGNHNAHE